MLSTNSKKKLVVTVCWILISQLLFFYADAYLTSQIPAELLASTYYKGTYNQFAYFFMSLLGGLFFGYLMVRPSQKATTFTNSILRVTGLFLAITFCTVILVTLLITLVANGVEGLTELPRIIYGVFSNKATIASILIWGFIVAGTQFMLQVSDKFGQGILIDFLTGKYFKPREETRIFMFLDLKSSTTIAEKTGHRKFFEFLTEVFKDVTQPIVDHKGEIYQYVGDEIIISWKMENGISNANCLRCFIAIHQKLLTLRNGYQEKYGVVAEFKAGVHHGEVTVGEMGVIKKDIVFSGDVLNTTARIQDQCNHYQANLLISEDTYSILKEHCPFKFRSLGEFELRGKERKINILALDEK